MAGSILKIGKVITKTAEKITINANNGDIIFNAAKNVKYAAQKEVLYDSYVAPPVKQTEELLVTKVVCDYKEVEVGKEYIFKAVQFSRKPEPGGKELEQVKWAYQIDDQEIQVFKNQGRVIGNTVVKKIVIAEDLWDNESLKVYAYINNEEEANVACKIKFEPIELLLLFYVDEWDPGTKMFKEAAQTRLNNIKNSDWYDPSIHKAHCPPIQTIDEIIEIIPKYYDKYGGKGKVQIKEIGVFSHSGLDGPICYDTKITICPYNEKGMQMAMCGWEQIDLVWVKQDAICVFYGCNSANEDYEDSKNFSKNIAQLSNFKDVEVWGQSKSSFPSFVPDYRITSAARSIPLGGLSWDLGSTYMVAGSSGQGYESLHSGSALDKIQTNKEELNKMPKAKPMNCYKNGTKIRSTHQGYFNDHRKTTVSTN
ncbi:hypothetical protein OQJ66_20030 [Aquimarina muelleri]|uniref:hypothetical protein n=3 Tax=Aquimarina muelleri TaxID=279356 RepID=UPI0022493CCE|nr:hypothetical protein [Aquimarina muelleri]MCX2765083.1 hypothetical protein [Aquimarina muelleri]